MTHKGGVKPGKKNKAEEPELEPLCCCEYIDRNGEKNHVAACLCDCQDLDDGCDRWITCKSVQPETCERIMDTVSDRLRIPWLRGAKKVNFSIIPPLVLLPVFLRVASWHFLLGVVVLTSLPVLALWYYYLTHRRKEQTLFFLSLGLFSLGYMYYVFLQEVVPRGRVGPTRLALLTCGLFLILFALCRAKKNPGYLRSPAGSERPGSGGPAERPGPGGQDKARGPLSSRAPREELRGPSGVPAGSPAKVKEDWCAKCQLVRPARAWHCRICGICVRRMDHHCVWINSCVGESNHQAFILALSVFLLTSVYGITLTLDTICRDRSVFTALFYCPGVYADYSSALAFTCVWYSVIVTAGMAYIFLIQLINISYNVTEREVQQALRQKTGRRLLCGLIVDTGQYNRGFLRNWHQFSTLGAPPFHHPAEDIV
ncbi:palmitoyltransferase ZDHHC23 isoform X1 [Vulpes lagopus]|uniref:palmitoyltransferase ZDHHC23 isoform X1 n=1 Tax=Vulpes lagopus TaxID=494514 RepID=UPI001BC933AD|nr:palmitoyltransferase ZDHHC23 isoform X1 [Vulpes lagopus]XP_041628302.1 palmitoyltransferase ZDHHC23 isoform X1 [Vulpes lagopus]XP_041628312.1 palmitoyltransferase ZDHHC23 isoform X1 [Vulpes lagopus]